MLLSNSQVSSASEIYVGRLLQEISFHLEQACTCSSWVYYIIIKLASQRTKQYLAKQDSETGLLFL